MVLTLMKSEQRMDTVGDRILAARQAKDLTQLDLSKRLGISRAAVGQWEINSTSPSIAKVEEIAAVLDVAPEWLAYNVTPGQDRIVYRNPERDNILWITEVAFGDTVADERRADMWGIPGEFLSRELRTKSDSTVIMTINGHMVEPQYEYGDKVFVDRSDRRPSPAGIFAFWDGIGMSFAQMQAVPGPQPRVRISQKGSETYETALADVTILGRIKGRIQRG